MTRQPGRVNRSALTVIELLVVIAIITILITIMFPAVQFAREKARQSTCRDSLKQIGLAFQMYHDAHKSFPSGFDRAWFGHGWGTATLPFLGHGDLYDQVRPNGNGYASRWGQADLIENTNVGLFLCPSSADRTTIHGTELGRSNYAGSSGPFFGLGQPPLGILYGGSIVTDGEIVDGLSNTLLVGEGEDDRRSHQKSIWAGTLCVAAQTTRRTDAASRLNSGDGVFGSSHPNIVQFVFCDGAVHRLTPSIDSDVDQGTAMSVFQRLGHRADGMPNPDRQSY